MKKSNRMALTLKEKIKLNKSLAKISIMSLILLGIVMGIFTKVLYPIRECSIYEHESGKRALKIDLEAVVEKVNKGEWNHILNATLTYNGNNATLTVFEIKDGNIIREDGEWHCVEREKIELPKVQAGGYCQNDVDGECSNCLNSPTCGNCYSAGCRWELMPLDQDVWMCTGSLDCSAYSTQGPCEGCSQCDWIYEPPQYYDNSTNSTVAGTAIEHSLYWTDDVNLDGFIFSFHNGTNTSSWSCTGSLDCDPLNKTACGNCSQCVLIGGCSGFPDGCGTHTNQTACENCGCDWASGSSGLTYPITYTQSASSDCQNAFGGACAKCDYDQCADCVPASCTWNPETEGCEGLPSLDCTPILNETFCNFCPQCEWAGNTLSNVTSNDASYATQEELDANWMNVSFGDVVNGTITYLQLIMEHYENDADVDLHLWFYNGTVWTEATQPTVSEGSEANYTYDLYANGIDTEAEADALNISFKCEAQAGGGDDCFVDFFILNYSYVGTCSGIPTPCLNQEPGLCKPCGCTWVPPWCDELMGKGCGDCGTETTCGNCSVAGCSWTETIEEFANDTWVEFSGTPGGEEIMNASLAINGSEIVTEKVNESDDDYAYDNCSGDITCTSDYIYFNFTTSDTYENTTYEGYWTGSEGCGDGFHCWSGSDWISVGSGFPEDSEGTATGSLTPCDNSDGNYTFRTGVACVGEGSVSAKLWVDYVYINKTGTLMNESWSNVTKVANSTVGTKIKWKIHANDTNDAWNVSDTYEYLTTSAGDNPPQYFDNSTNSTEVGENIEFRLRWIDDSGLSYYHFAFDNCTGTLTNITNGTLSGTEDWVNITRGINITTGCTIRWQVYANDSIDQWNTSDEFSFVTTGAYIEVNLVYPPLNLNVIQNTTFNVNATVTCRKGSCGTVKGTVRYNASSVYPDTPINSTKGDKPFYNTSGAILQSCGSMSQDQSCQLNWTVNATGAIDSSWKVGVLFNSTESIPDNHTDNATITITNPPLISLWSPKTLDFGTLSPSTKWNNATNNTDNFYNISIDSGSCTVDIWIRGTDLENTTLSTKIGVGNVTWNNYFNWTASTNMTKTYALVNSSISQNTNITTYYWLNVPAIFAGGYNGTITICANCTTGGDPC